MQQLRDRLLSAQIDVMSRADRFRRRSRAAVENLIRGERGQTPTEYLMIVGLMAVVIVFVFVTYYWENVKTAAQTWTGNVKSSVTGDKIK